MEWSEGGAREDEGEGVYPGEGLDGVTELAAQQACVAEVPEVDVSSPESMWPVRNAGTEVAHVASGGQRRGAGGVVETTAPPLLTLL